MRLVAASASSAVFLRDGSLELCDVFLCQLDALFTVDGMLLRQVSEQVEYV